MDDPITLRFLMQRKTYQASAAKGSTLLPPAKEVVGR